MKKNRYNTREHNAFKEVVNEYRGKKYLELSRLAATDFVDTEHPISGIQVGISVFYDDKKTGDVRATFSLYVDSKNVKWWKFWQVVARPVLNEDFIMNRNGKFLGE